MDQWSKEGEDVAVSEDEDCSANLNSLSAGSETIINGAGVVKL